MLFYILLFTFIASISSLFLVGILLLHKKLIKKFSFYLVSFAAGALLSTGFLEAFKEAVSEAGEIAFLWVTIAFTVFFIVEKLFLFIHHHDSEESEEKIKHHVKAPTSFLLFGDSLHNFIDGASIAAGFLVSFPLGVITSLTVFVHEIPHELGDFGILLSKGWKRGKVFQFNIITGLTAFLGAILAFELGTQFKNITPLLLAITAGNFIYLSATDLLPEIHRKSTKKKALAHILFFLLGIILVAFLIEVLD